MKGKNSKLLVLIWSVSFTLLGYVTIMFFWWNSNEREIRNVALEYPWISVVAESVNHQNLPCDIGPNRTMQKVEALWFYFQTERGNQVGERKLSVMAEFLDISGFQFSFYEPTSDFAGRARNVDQHKERFDLMLGAARARHPGFASVLKMGPVRYFEILNLVGSKTNFFSGSVKMQIFKTDSRIALIEFLCDGLISVNLMIDIDNIIVFQYFSIREKKSAIESKDFFKCLLLDIISTIEIRNVEEVRASWEVMTDPLPGVRE